MLCNQWNGAAFGCTGSGWPVRKAAKGPPLAGGVKCPACPNTIATNTKGKHVCQFKAGVWRPAAIHRGRATASPTPPPSPPAAAAAAGGWWWAATAARACRKKAGVCMAGQACGCHSVSDATVAVVICPPRQCVIATCWQLGVWLACNTSLPVCNAPRLHWHAALRPCTGRGRWLLLGVAECPPRSWPSRGTKALY